MPRSATTGRFRRHSVAAAWLLCAWSVVGFGAAPSAHSAESERPFAAEPNPRIGMLEDVSGTLSLTDVLELEERFVETDARGQNIGFTSSAHWFAFSLERPDRGDAWLVEIAYPLLDRIDFHSTYDDGHVEHVRAGDELPFDERPMKHRAFVFPVEFDGGRESADVLVRVASGSSMQVPIRVLAPEEFHARNHDTQLFLGLYYGLLLAILLYNAMLAMSVREAVYFHYSLYVLSYAVFQMCLNGLAFEYLWPSSTYLADKGTLVFMALSATFATLFAREILEITSRQRRLHAIFRLYTAWSAAALPLAFVLPYAIAIQAQTALVVAGTLLFACSGVIRHRAGVAAARFYLLAWSLFLIGIAVYALKTYGLLPENAVTEYAIQVGSALEVVLLSFAIAHRVKVLREENLRAQRESTTLLEDRVAERTSALERTLEELSVVNGRLKTLSTVDALSGLHNRAHFNERFESMWSSARLSGSSVAVLMIDIDRFKAVNDTYGHLAGDDVISGVARTIAGSVGRPGDLVARYGGEEFVVVLPSTDARAAAGTAERIREAVARAETGSGGGARPGPMTVSIGVAAEVPGAGNLAARSETLLEAADSALYRAKREGRNRVAVADDGFVPSAADDRLIG